MCLTHSCDATVPSTPGPLPIKNIPWDDIVLTECARKYHTGSSSQLPLQTTNKYQAPFCSMQLFDADCVQKSISTNVHRHSFVVVTQPNSRFRLLMYSSSLPTSNCLLPTSTFSFPSCHQLVLLWKVAAGTLGRPSLPGMFDCAATHRPTGDQRAR